MLQRSDFDDDDIVVRSRPDIAAALLGTDPCRWRMVHPSDFDGDIYESLQVEGVRLFVANNGHAIIKEDTSSSSQSVLDPEMSAEQIRSRLEELVARNENLQTAIGCWTRTQFGPSTDSFHDALAIAEEAGEVCRAILKRHQADIGTSNRNESLEHWEQAIRDEVADLIITALSLAENEGFDAMAETRRRFNEVRQRRRGSEEQ